MGTFFGGIEAGGTKFVCAIGEPPDAIHETTRFPTTSPDETLERTQEFFRQADVELDALGIASFGPVDPDPSSSSFGTITTTPKPGWQQVDFVGRMRSFFDGPIGFDTDVNAAALAEYRWGRAKDLDSVVYVTVGTGIGGGGVFNGHRLHGMMHPEMGHMRLPREREEDDDYEGACPYHGDCLEGLASGAAIEDRWDRKGEALPADHRAWKLEAQYLAHGVVNMTCILSPECIVLGGGVMEREELFPMIRERVQSLLAGYLPDVEQDLEAYIAPPALGDRAGVLGALALAMEQCED